MWDFMNSVFRARRQPRIRAMQVSLVSECKSQDPMEARAITCEVLM